MLRFFLITFILLIFKLLSAQFYNSGQDDNSIKWKQINTEKFRLIYPDFAEDKAQKFANKLLWASRNVGSDLDSTITKIDVVMHMKSSTSNAMVIWAPKRMEVHSLNSQNSYAQEWFEQLALHEYRHVVQIDKLNEGFTKLLSYVFGEMGTSVVLGAYLPLWYLEGDAVATETALSNTGRGREANFNMPLRAQLSEIGKYSYDKATMGSYRNFIPNHYILGYHLVSHGKKYYGDSIWRNTESFIARNPYYIVPFSHSIRKHSGLRKLAFYESCMDTLTNMWAINSTDFIVDTLIFNPENKYTSFTNTQYINDSTLFTYKSGINVINSFTKVSSQNSQQKQQKILLPSYGSFDNIAVSDSFIFWTEKRYHNRWQNSSYSVLMSYNFTSEKRSQLSKKTRYYFPTYSAKANLISCLSQSIKGDYSLMILSSIDGSIIDEIEMPSFIKNPYIDNSGEHIYYYILKKKGFALMEYTIALRKEKQILPASYNNRNRIIKYNNSLYITDDISGVSNVFKIDLNDNKLMRISDVKFGVGKIHRWKNKLIYDNYSASGWQAAVINLDTVSEYNNTDFSNDLYKSYIYDSTINIQNTTYSDSIFSTMKYSKFKHLLNVHSWGPLSINIDNTEINPGISVLSQNLLSTMEVNVGYEYILAENVGKYYANIDYKAMPIRLSFQSSYQDRRANDSKSYTWNETKVGLNINRGFSFNRNAYNYYLQASAGVYYLRLGANADTPESFGASKELTSMDYGLYFSQLHRRAYRDLQSRWGQQYRFFVSNTPFGGIDLGSIYAVDINYYLPFVFPHSGLKTYLGFQKVNNINNYSYSNIIQLPRTYISGGTSDAFSLKTTIAIPLFYPDLSIASLAYIKRVKTYIFADYFLGYEKYTSLGADLRFDVHFLRTIAPFDIGIRMAYLTELGYDNHYINYQFLLNVSF